MNILGLEKMTKKTHEANIKKQKLEQEYPSIIGLYEMLHLTQNINGDEYSSLIEKIDEIYENDKEK